MKKLLGITLSLTGTLLFSADTETKPPCDTYHLGETHMNKDMRFEVCTVNKTKALTWLPVKESTAKYSFLAKPDGTAFFFDETVNQMVFSIDQNGTLTVVLGSRVPTRYLDGGKDMAPVEIKKVLVVSK